MSRISIREDTLSDSDSSWERLSNTTSLPTLRSGYSATNSMSNESESDYALGPGVYYIENDQNRDMVIDLAGYDGTTILGYAKHGRENQMWEFARLGPGYSIKSVSNDTYITLNTGAIDGASLIASPFPLSWEVERDEIESWLWRIRWPKTTLAVDLPNVNANQIVLRSSNALKPTGLWRLVEVPGMQPRENVLEFTTKPPKVVQAKPSVLATADTVVDVEGLKLGGNGEMSITTTTTTVTTSVTTVKKLGIA